MLWKKNYTRRIKHLEVFARVFKKLDQSPINVTPEDYIELNYAYEQLKQYTRSTTICDFIKDLDNMIVRYSRNAIYYKNNISTLIKEASSKSVLSGDNISPPDLRFIFMLYQNSDTFMILDKKILRLIKYYQDKAQLSTIGQMYYQIN